MKEINGKIKFGVVPIFNGEMPNAERHVIICELSSITEEQAAEFVGEIDFLELYRDYLAEKNNGLGYLITSAKESLISLLKANDVWIKEWSKEPSRMTTNALSDKNKDRVLSIRQKIYLELPDDLLIVKL